jgi:DNA repair protein RadC
VNEQRPTIREWPPEDRPRERFLTKGPDALSDTECLALLLGGGGPGQTVLDQAQALLAAFGSLAELADREVQEIAWVGGLGIVKAVRLGAAIELSRRLRARPNGGRVRLSTPEEVAGYFGPGLEGKKKEIFRVD